MSESHKHTRRETLSVGYPVPYSSLSQGWTQKDSSESQNETRELSLQYPINMRACWSTRNNRTWGGQRIPESLLSGHWHSGSTQILGQRSQSGPTAEGKEHKLWRGSTGVWISAPLTSCWVFHETPKVYGHISSSIKWRWELVKTTTTLLGSYVVHLT